MVFRKNTAWESYIPGVCGVGFVGDAEFGYHEELLQPSRLLHVLSRII